MHNNRVSNSKNCQFQLDFPKTVITRQILTFRSTVKFPTLQLLNTCILPGEPPQLQEPQLQKIKQIEEVKKIPTTKLKYYYTLYF